MWPPLSALFSLLIVAVVFSVVQRSSSDPTSTRQLIQDRHHGHGEAQPVPFAYCKPFLESLSHMDQHQLRESYQQYHSAYAKYMRAARNHEAFQKGPAIWMNDEAQRQGWNLTYLVGNNIEDLASVLDEATSLMKTMENRIKAQLDRLQGQGNLPADTAIDNLSPCIMRKIYPSHFPDQPAVSLLLHLRGDEANPGDWPNANASTPEPPTGRGPEIVAAFVNRTQKCGSVVSLELIVALSGPAVMAQATTWAWQSWQSEGFVVPMLDILDRDAHALNRMASVARGSVLVALRADRSVVEDLLPDGSDCSWLQRIATLYHRIPQLGAMTHGRFSFSHPATDTSLRMLGTVPGAAGPLGTNMFFKEKVTSVPFQYVLYGDLMPMSFRRSALEEVGGFDEDLPQGDEPCRSYIRRDLTLRLWKSGWRVGAHDAGLLQQPVLDDRPAANSDLTRCSPDVAALAAQLLDARHGLAGASSSSSSSPTPLDVVMSRVRQLNMGELEPLGADVLSACPMAQGCQA